MPDPLTRRDLLATASIGLSAALAFPARVLGAPTNTDDSNLSPAALAAFPAQDPSLVRAIVGASHGNVDRVKELLHAQPRLANAAWDWGFGDWETALGAASHTGNRQIAAMLIESGARPDLFTHAMLGHLEIVRATIAASPGIERTRGPHGITLLNHAKAGGPGAASVVEFLATMPGADESPVDLPLADDLKQIYSGTYRFGKGTLDLLEVGEPKAGSPYSIRRSGGDPRRLFHLGEHAFHPAGAHDTRLLFLVQDGRADRLTITSPAMLCNAERIR